MSSTWCTSSPVWTAAGWTMLHSTWVGAAIGLMAALVRRLLISARPETRYGAALSCLAMLAVSPALICIWVYEPMDATHLPILRATESGSQSPAILTNPGRLENEQPPPPAVAWDHPAGLASQSWLKSVVPCLPWFWMSGSACTLAMLATGLMGVEQLRRQSRPVVSVDVPRRCRALADSLGIARRVSVGICDRLAMPVLIGIVRPLILLPPVALCGWSVEQLEMVLLHELAHLRRWDNLVNLLQRFVESLLFFNPVVWWLSGWVRLERELCCDRLVVERVGQPFAYAEMLVELSGMTRGKRQAMVAMADRQVLTRIRRLLNLEERSMKLTMPEGLGLLGAVIVGGLLVLGTRAAPSQVVYESYKQTQQVPGMPDLKAIPVAERLTSNDAVIAVTPPKPGLPKRVPPKNPRAISLFHRDARRLQIVQLPTTLEGVVTYRCRGGIRIVCKSQKFGTISMEADEALIKRVERGEDNRGVVASNGETWIDEVDLPMEVQLKGNAVISQKSFPDNGDQRTIRAPLLDYDFVTERLVAPPVEFELALQLTPVPASRQRTTSVLARSAQQLLIKQLAETIEGVVTLECRGGVKIVSKSPRFGTVSMEADEAVIVRNLYRRKGETHSGPDEATWVEEDELPMRVHLKGDVVLRQNQETNAKNGKPKTFRARELDYNFVTDRVLALDAELEEATAGPETPVKIASPRIEQFHRMVRQPDGSLAPSEHPEIRVGGGILPKPSGEPSSASTKTKDPKTSAP
jgi:beta-lactamase regulating signal transducer with metallopeptidase domain